MVQLKNFNSNVTLKFFVFKFYIILYGTCLMFYVFKYSTVTTRLSQLYFNVKLGTQQSLDPNLVFGNRHIDMDPRIRIRSDV